MFEDGRLNRVHFGGRLVRVDRHQIDRGLEVSGRVDESSSRDELLRAFLLRLDGRLADLQEIRSEIAWLTRITQEAVSSDAVLLTYEEAALRLSSDQKTLEAFIEAGALVPLSIDGHRFITARSLYRFFGAQVPEIKEGQQTPPRAAGQVDADADVSARHLGE
jgi:hypothetical protein